ncbi:hypothetical protein RN02_03755 [Pseudomonas sp. PI1]|nr:hypothetical protein RN02_03755 [Pseudomonas sp. PI1]
MVTLRRRSIDMKRSLISIGAQLGVQGSVSGNGLVRTSRLLWWGIVMKWITLFNSRELSQFSRTVELSMGVYIACITYVMPTRKMCTS